MLIRKAVIFQKAYRSKWSGYDAQKLTSYGAETAFGHITYILALMSILQSMNS